MLGYGKLGLRSLPKLALLLLSVSLSPIPSCLSSLPTSFLLDFLPHFAHREGESERENEGREGGDPVTEKRYAAFGWRIHGGVEDTELSTNKQLSLSPEQGRPDPNRLSKCLNGRGANLQEIFYDKIS
jgi:hypothetical protein